VREADRDSEATQGAALALPAHPSESEAAEPSAGGRAWPRTGLRAGLRAGLRVWRRGFTAFVARHELAWDLSLGVLALVFLAVGFLEDHPFAGLDPSLLALLDGTITWIFIAEFALRCYAADSRRGYLARHWIDLLALLPAIRALRVLRLGRLVYLLQAARVFRVGVLVRFLAQVDRASKDLSWVAKRNGVHLFFLAAAGIVTLGGLLVWDLEAPSNPAFHNLGDALWWAFATMSTVGYGPGPMTVAGRVVAALIMVVGIACFGVLTATVSAYFTRRAQQAGVAELTLHDLTARLDEMAARLERIERQTSGASRGAAGAPAHPMPPAHLAHPAHEMEPKPVSGTSWAPPETREADATRPADDARPPLCHP
jgi:voltage-gated potassium channel